MPSGLELGVLQLVIRCWPFFRDGCWVGSLTRSLAANRTALVHPHRRMRKHTKRKLNGPRCTRSASLASKPPSSDATKPFWPRRSRRMPGWGIAWTEWEHRQGVFLAGAHDCSGSSSSSSCNAVYGLRNNMAASRATRRTQTSKRLTERSAHRRRAYGQKCRRSYTHHAVVSGTEIDTHLLDRLTTRSALTR